MTIDQFFACSGSVIACVSFIALLLRNHRIDIMIAIKEVDRKVERLNDKVERLSDKVEDIDRRLCRMEGAFSSRDFCGLRNQHDRKEG